ncbi:MAG: MBL fold metallo-hydrolase [Cytophagaceae bacterium]
MKELLVKILGSGDAFSSGGRNQTSFFVRKRDKGILIDCGATTLKALKGADISTNEIDVIFISHFHGDHYGGMPFVLLDMAIMNQRTKALTIISPPGGKEKLEQLNELLYPGTSLSSFPIEYLEYTDRGMYSIGDISFQAFSVVHSAPTFPHALRIKIGSKILAFSGDTSWTDTLYEVANEADIFICECNFRSTQMNNHLNLKEIKKNFTKFNAKKVVLTHLGTEMLTEKGDDEVELAYDGMEINF